MDDILPAKEKFGREAEIEKKKLLNQKLNGSKDETGLEEYNESDLFGENATSSFAKAKAYQN